MPSRSFKRGDTNSFPNAWMMQFWVVFLIDSARMELIITSSYQRRSSESHNTQWTVWDVLIARVRPCSLTLSGVSESDRRLWPDMDWLYHRSEYSRKCPDVQQRFRRDKQSDVTKQSDKQQQSDKQSEVSSLTRDSVQVEVVTRSSWEVLSRLRIRLINPPPPQSSVTRVLHIFM